MARRNKTRGKKQAHGVICVVVEGKATEVDYIDGFRRALGLKKEHVLVKPGKHTAVGDLIGDVKSVRKSLLSEGKIFDEWWVLGDSEGATVNAAALKRKAHTFGTGGKDVVVAVNDPSIEAFLLMHFVKPHRHYENAHEAVVELGLYIKGYDDDHKHVRFADFADTVGVAIQRAGNLRERNRREGNVDGFPDVDTDILLRRIAKLAKVDARSLIGGQQPLAYEDVREAGLIAYRSAGTPTR